jgi:wyosine [tRNA(Phe)-imidazoG37] synthetase (radical SAM superfamily)
MDLIPAHLDHRRSYQDNLYVYPVISRRSRGVSIGINLNPDKICNFNCVYCEVDRRTPARTRTVDLALLETELRELIALWRSGELFAAPPFDSTPSALRRLNDIAFSGDGEPTTCPLFEDAVKVAFRMRAELGLADQVKLVLITDAACLNRPGVKNGLRLMAQGPHEIWAKLDAGTPDYFKKVNRTAIPLDRILRNIVATASEIPLWIQTLFLRLHGKPPPPEEVSAYIQRIHEMEKQGARFHGIQLYTVARPTPEAWATALAEDELEAIALRLEKEIGLRVERFHGNGA